MVHLDDLSKFLILRQKLAIRPKTPARFVKRGIGIEHDFKMLGLSVFVFKIKIRLVGEAEIVAIETEVTEPKFIQHE